MPITILLFMVLVQIKEYETIEGVKCSRGNESVFHRFSARVFIN